MHDGPTGAVLLAIARATLLDEILPLVPAAHTYTLRMIANAMAIAARELGTDCASAEPGFRARIAALYRDATAPQPPADLASIELERRLAADIRAGHLDTAGPELSAFLVSKVEERLALANPKLLSAPAKPG